MKYAILPLLAVLMIGCSGFGADSTQADITLHWTAPGDDGDVGQATEYQVCVATDSMDLVNNWGAGEVIADLPVPSLAGEADSALIQMWVDYDTDYYFALKTADEVPNWSGLSNIAVVNVPTPADTIPPAMVIDITIEVIW